MRYIIYGAGGIGGGIGAQLFQQGHQVILVCRGAHLATIQRRGLTLKTPRESVTLKIPAVGDPSQIDFRDKDVVLLSMKSQDTEQALRALCQAADDTLPVVCAKTGSKTNVWPLGAFAAYTACSYGCPPPIWNPAS